MSTAPQLYVVGCVIALPVVGPTWANEAGGDSLCRVVMGLVGAALWPVSLTTYLAEVGARALWRRHVSSKQRRTVSGLQTRGTTR